MELPTKDRVHPLAQYLLALAGTIGAYAGYNAFVVPRIEGTPPVPRGVSQVQRTLANDDDSLEWLRPWLPADAWELGKCKSLRTGDSLLLFQDYVTHDDGSVQIYPLTIVLGGGEERGSDPESLRGLRDTASDPVRAPPIILRAAEQAELVFDRPLQLGGEGPGRLLQGRLPGRVEIVQPGTGGSTGTRVVTSNLQLTPRRVFTLEPVEFVHEGSRGSGRNLVLDLDHAAPPGNINAGFASVTGLARMELAFLDYLELVASAVEDLPETSGQHSSGPPTLRSSVPGGPVEMTVRETSAVGVPAAGHLPQPLPTELTGKTGQFRRRGEEMVSRADGSAASLESVRVLCRGPLVFDFKQQTATFRDQVVVQATDGSGDELQGDLLQVIFRRELEPGSTSAGSSERSLARLKPDQVIAEGKPARLVLPSRGASAAAEKLEYHIGLSQLRAVDSRAVIVRQAGQEFVARSLEYRLRDDRTLGPLLAQGPGQLLARPDGAATGDGKAWKVSFGEQLTIQPDGARRLVTLSGGATMEPEPGQQIQGDQVQLWLEPGPAGPDNETDTDEALSTTYQPVRAEVTGNVQVQLDQLGGTTGRLVAEWTPADPAWRQSSSPPRRIGPRQLHLRPVFASASAPPPAAELPPLPVLAEDPPFSPSRLLFQSSEIRVALERGTGNSVPRAVELSGQVIVQQFKAEPRQEKGSVTDSLLIPARPDETVPNPGGFRIGLEVTGDWLQLVPAGADLWRAHVTGTAAIATEELKLTGNDLQLDQAASRAWVTGPGELQLKRRGAEKAGEKEELRGPQSGAVRHDGQGGAAPQSLNVTWQGGMIFDGGRVWFEQQVRSEASRVRGENGRAEDIRTVSEGLTITFDRPISFQQQTDGVGDSGDGPQVRKLSLVGRLVPGQQAFPLAAASDPTAAGTSVVLERTLRDEANRVTGREVMLVPAVDADLESGDIRANGPGSLMHWRPAGKGDQGGLFGAAASPAGPPEPEQPSGITCLHVNFDGQLVANSKRTEMQIDGQVRGVFGPVGNWEEQLNPAQAPPPAGCTRLTCQSVSLVQWTPEAAGSPMTDLVATGDAVILGDAFEARGRRISYHQQNDLLVLEGDGRTDANLWHASRPGAPRNQLVAGNIFYRPGDGWTLIEKVRSATINQGR